MENIKCKVCKKHIEKEKLAPKSKDTCIECFNKPKPKFLYDVKVNCMLPATLTYRVLAEDPKQAAELIKNISPNSVQHKLIGRKEIKLMVYKCGCCIVEFIKNLGG